MMKKYLYLPIVLLLSVSACQKLEEMEMGADSKANILTASIDPETRTMLQKDDYGYDNIWSEGDEIDVFIDGGAKSKYTIKDGVGTPRATFSGEGSGSSYVALYPAGVATGIDGSRLSLDLPAEQDYASASFGPNSFPMVAVSNTSDLTFRNLGSVLRVSIAGSATIQSITFTANDSEVFVSGPATADFSQPETPLLTMAENGGRNELTLHCRGGVALTGDQAVDFYMVLPPQLYKGGFTLTISSTCGTMVKRTSKDVEMRRSEVRTASLTFEVTEGVVPSETLAGEGTDSNPFLIQNISDMLLFRNAVNNADMIASSDSGQQAAAQTAVYQLQYDIDLSAAGPWTPIGTDANSFNGTFNGGGHAITGLKVESASNNAGLFGYCYEPTIKYLAVSGEVNGAANVGIIAGSVNGGTLIHCESHGAVSGTGNYVGGIAGYFALSLINGNYIKQYGTISDCSNYAEVSGKYSIGGVVGYLYYSNMNACMNYAAVKSSSNCTGGIVGRLFYSKVYNCANSGKVTGWMQLGGIAGWILSGGTVENCYNIGEISILNYTNAGIIGGIAGENEGTLANCVGVGVFSGNTAGRSAFGGIVGENSGSVSNCYGVSTSGAADAVGEDSGSSECVYSLSEAQMGSTESIGMALYTDSDGIYYTNLTDALNAWAADHGTGSIVYYGWEYAGSFYPVFTLRPAVKPGSGSSEQLTHAFGISHINKTFALPVITGSYMNATVDWGEGGGPEVYGMTQKHDYTTAGEHEVVVAADNAMSFKLNSLVGVKTLSLN